jgi:hypothetical protein
MSVQRCESYNIVTNRLLRTHTLFYWGLLHLTSESNCFRYYYQTNVYYEGHLEGKNSVTINKYKLNLSLLQTLCYISTK